MNSRALAYARGGHRRVHGWLSQTAVDMVVDLTRVHRDLGVRGPVCEIGVHHGRLFILLHLLSDPPERSVAWDLFEDQAQNIDRSGRGDRAQFEANLRRHGADMTRVVMFAANSTHLTPADVVAACGGPPRIFSIDGGHTPGITLSDLTLAASSVSPDGLIILDDFFNESWPGVAEGTCRYFQAPTVPLFPVAIGGNKVIFAKNSIAAERYRTRLSLPQAAYKRRDTEMFGLPVLVLTAAEPTPYADLLRRTARRRLKQLRKDLRRLFR